MKNDFLNVLSPFIGADLNLLSVNNVNNIPNEGNGLVVVAKLNVGNTLHFRFFNSTGVKVVDKSETQFPGKSTEIQSLKEELADLWDQGQLTNEQEWKIIDAVRSITGYTPLIDQIDALSGHFINHLHRLNQFGMPQTGFGFIYDRKSSIYAAVYKKVLDYKKRWEEKKTTFEDLMTNQFPAATTDEERIGILQKAERTISTVYSIPVPTVAEYLAILNGSVSEVGKKALFDNKFNELETFLNGNFLNLKDLVDEVDNLKTNLDTFDLLTIETEEEERQIVVFAEDLNIQATKLSALLEKKSAVVQKLLDEHNVTVISKEKVQKLTEAAKILFGEDFQIVPEFSLGAKQRNELQNCLDNQSQLLNFQIKEQSNDFPLDEWLYGLAEKLGAWENLVMLAEGFKDSLNLNLTPIQLPFKEYDLNLMSLNNADDLPTEGKCLVIVAKIVDVYHARIFDQHGKKVIDKGKDEFLPDERLVQELEVAFSSQSIDQHTKSKLLRKITSSLSYTKANDSWLGLAYPEDMEIEGDKLLYTAYLPNRYKPAHSQRGLLVDQWTEVIPTKKETTGITFHYDRPNSEPPQTLLLVTPSAFTGSWKWEDLVNTLHETLNLAKLRAVEPDQIDQTDYAQLLPATVAAVATYPVTMFLNYVMQANQVFSTKSEDNG